MIPTSAALDAAIRALLVEYPIVEPYLLSIRRLQHEASTTAKGNSTATVFDLDAERARRLRAEMACYDDDPEAA